MTTVVRKITDKKHQCARTDNPDDLLFCPMKGKLKSCTQLMKTIDKRLLNRLNPRKTSCSKCGAHGSLEEMVSEYQEIHKEMKKRGITRAGRPEADVLISRENRLWEGIRDVYLEKLDKIPSSKQIKPDGLGVLALAGRATIKAVQESPSKVNLDEMVSEWLKPKKRG